MRYALILTVLAGGDADLRTLNAVAGLARRHEAALRVIPSAPLADAVAWADAFGGVAFAAGTAREIAETTVRLRDRIRETVAAVAERTGHSVQVIDETLPPWLVMMHEAPLADMVVVSHETIDGFWAGLPADALMYLRLPVLIVRSDEPVEGGLAAVAWDGSLASGRAVRAALPLLQAAERVVILQDPDGLNPDERRAGDPARLTAFLEGFGVGAAAFEKVTGRSEGQALAAAAKDLGARLLVAGAYGHARLREAVIGGATRALTSVREGPHLLLAH